MNMYVDGGKIVDDAKKEYTEAEARTLWEAGKVADYNLAFKRLTTLAFSLAALKQYYELADRNR